MKSTHLVDYGTGKSPALAIVCGNYYRPLRKFLFGGNSKVLPWQRMPADVRLISCEVPMIEKEGSGMLGTSDNIN
jgi:hypothetical protein